MQNRPQILAKKIASRNVFGGSWTRTNGDRSRGIYSQSTVKYSQKAATLNNMYISMLNVICLWQ
jgi:hypothetical protein